MGTQRRSVTFTLGGLPVRLSQVGERWVAQVGESVAVGSGALQVLTAALNSIDGVTASVLLADLALLAPSLEVASIEQNRQSA